MRNEKNEIEKQQKLYNKKMKNIKVKKLITFVVMNVSFVLYTLKHNDIMKQKNNNME